MPIQGAAGGERERGRERSQCLAWRHSGCGHQFGRLNDIMLMMIAGQFAARSARHRRRGRRSSSQCAERGTKVTVIHIVIVGGARFRLDAVCRRCGRSVQMMMMAMGAAHSGSGCGCVQMMMMMWMLWIVRRGRAIAQGGRVRCVAAVRCVGGGRGAAAGRVKLRCGSMQRLPGAQLGLRLMMGLMLLLLLLRLRRLLRLLLLMCIE